MAITRHKATKPLADDGSELREQIGVHLPWWHLHAAPTEKSEGMLTLRFPPSYWRALKEEAHTEAFQEALHCIEMWPTPGETVVLDIGAKELVAVVLAARAYERELSEIVSATLVYCEVKEAVLAGKGSDADDDGSALRLEALLREAFVTTN